MASKKTKAARVPIDVIGDVQSSVAERFKKGLMKKPDVTEGFRLMKRMPEWSTIQNKLKSLPRKEDVK